MSRIIVKGLPATIKEDRLRSLFSDKGQITDCSMKYTKDGVFRRFAFVGYKEKKDAEAAVKFFNQSFVDTSKIMVEIAKEFGDESKPRSWSKYSRDSSAYKKMKEKLEAKKKEAEKQEPKAKSKKKKLKDKKMDELLGDLKDDPEFQDFLDVHKSSSNKQLWSNDIHMQTPKAVKTDNETKHEDCVDNDSGLSGVETDVEEEVEKEAIQNVDSEKKDSEEKSVSDLDYLKSKMSKKSKVLSDDDSSDSEDECENKEDNTRKRDSDDDDDDDYDNHDDEVDGNSDDNYKNDVIEKTEQPVTHVIKMRGLPNTVKEKQLKEFFNPLTVKSIKIPKNAAGKSAFRMATVEFENEIDTDQAMRRNKNFIGPKRIFLHKVKKEIARQSTSIEQSKPWEEKLQEKDDGEEETIAESGRLFVRNLAYCCSEDDLETLFTKYGPLTEVNLPVDSLTKKVKGFAFITFMMPEHAVNAFTELDGTVFQGRMLHILPGKEKKEAEEDSKEGSSYKKQKDAKQKKLAQSSHNWNALFLGANAVANVMAEKYGKSKSQILDTGARESLGVRMALGETQIVAETREFLIENGVALDSFSQASGQRSKTVMLAKNLPSGTSAEELMEIFSKHGSVASIILPPSGVTAIVELLEPSEARNAFRKLAYTKFKHLPLYLEWAPQNVFSADRKKYVSANQQESKGSEESQAKSKPMEEETTVGDNEEEAEETIEPESVLFVKNINFDTTEESLTKLFIQCGKLRNVVISKKKDLKNPGKFLSMGYGFVEYKKKRYAQKALKTLQHATLDEHQLELKVSNRATAAKTGEQSGHKKQDANKKQTGTKILVRNVPFEAKPEEVRELFSVFGELKTVRLPKKLSGTGPHRGFGFVDFLTKQDAKRAFNALCHSTHLYGRRLVLEWADSEESIDELRKKTAQHFFDGPQSKRLKKADLQEDLEVAAAD